MTYGPFSLADAQDARLGMRAWVNTEGNFDFFWIVASTDGTNFSGYKFSGNWTGLTADGWLHWAISFSELSNRRFSTTPMIGQPQVWFATIFTSDSSVIYEGVYVDKVVLEKITGGYQSITNDALEHYQWSLSNNGQRWGTAGMDLKALSAWGKVPATSNVTIAIIDEGVDLTHPDLMGKLVPGYDATGHGSFGGPSGNEAHGTNCAGIAAALTNNSVGVAGVAANCKIMPVRIFYDNSTTDVWAADGISWAASHGADVLSNSWGGGTPSTLITNAIINAKTTGRGGKGCVVCFSSGNDNGAVSYPANLGYVISVGAISPTGERKSPNSSDGEYWWGSNYGSELAIVAPGTLCYSTDIAGTAGYWSGDYFPNFNGTSAACPHVAGVAGLVLSRNAGMTAARVEKALLNSATDLNIVGWDPETGYGLVNAYGAVLKASGSSVPMQLLLLD
jgi:subtilisin family serine protease